MLRAETTLNFAETRRVAPSCSCRAFKSQNELEENIFFEESGKHS
jgi:hypothetical protein